jgi:hypothetical protein
MRGADSADTASSSSSSTTRRICPAYAHLDQISVKEGQIVGKGQELGKMGNTDADQVKLHSRSARSANAGRSRCATCRRLNAGIGRRG